MKEIVFILFRRKKEATIFALCMILIPMTIAYVVTPKYKSAGSFIVTPGRFKKPFIPNEKDSQTGFVQITMEDVASEVEMMTSRPIVEKVVAINHLDVFPSPSKDQFLKYLLDQALKAFDDFLVFINLKAKMPDFEVAVQKFINDVDIEYVKRSNIITVEWAGHSPEQAQNVINTFIDEYTKHHVQVWGNAEALKVIKSQVDSDYAELTKMENSIEELKAKHQLYDIDKERSSALEKFLEAKSRYDSLYYIDPNNIIGTNTGLYSDDPSMVKLINDLVDAKVEGLDVLSKYGKDDRKSIINQQKVSELQTIIKANHLKNLASWRERETKFQDRVSLLDNLKLELDSLGRKKNSILDRYQTNLQKYNEAVISSAMDNADIASVRVVQYAELNTTPSFPKKLLLLIICIFFAIFGGIATAFYIEKNSSRIGSFKDLHELCDLPILFSWPLFNKSELMNEDAITNVSKTNMVSITKYISDNASDTKVHLVISPSPGVGSTFLTRQMARYAAYLTQEPALFLTFNYLPKSASLKFDTLDKINTNIISSIKKSNDIDTLSIDLHSGDVLREKMISKLIASIKSLGYANVFIDIPNERNDYNFISFLSSMNYVYINLGTNLTDKQALRRYLSVIQEQTGIKPVGCVFNMHVKVIPDFIYKRL